MSIPTQSVMVDSPEQRTRALGYGLARAAPAIVRASLRQWSGDPSLLAVSRGTQALAVSRSGLKKAGGQFASAHRPLHSTMSRNIRAAAADGRPLGLPFGLHGRRPPGCG